MLVNNKVPFSQIPLPLVGDDINVVAVKAEDINIFMFYVAHPDSNILIRIKNLLTSVSGPLLIMGDFNCHHYRWGSEVCDSMGIELVDLLDELDLCVINDGSPIWYATAAAIYIGTITTVVHGAILCQCT